MDEESNEHSVAEGAGEFGGKTGPRLTVASEVWVVTALLHREHPNRQDFSTAEIVARAREARLCGQVRGSFAVHVNQHCVANRRPNTARLRMLLETSRGRRRLFRPGDPYDPMREGGRTMPDPRELPAKLIEILHWYESKYAATAGTDPAAADPILALRGRGAEIRGREHPDEYVRRLREDWA